MFLIICDKIEKNSNKIWWDLYENWERLKINKKFGTIEELRIKLIKNWAEFHKGKVKNFNNLKIKIFEKW
jgi:hypothetical protein